MNSDGTWEYVVDPNKIVPLDGGEQAHDSFTFTASDGSVHEITMTVTGTEDAAIVSGIFEGEVTEPDNWDTPIQASGTLSIMDPDSNDTPAFNNVTLQGSYGKFELVNGQWTYTLDKNISPDIAHGETETDNFTLTATDGTEREIKVDVKGSPTEVTQITHYQDGNENAGDDDSQWPGWTLDVNNRSASDTEVQLSLGKNTDTASLADDFTGVMKLYSAKSGDLLETVNYDTSSGLVNITLPAYEGQIRVLMQPKDDVLKEGIEQLTIKAKIADINTDWIDSAAVSLSDESGTGDTVDITLTQDKPNVTEGDTITYTVKLSHAAPAGSKVMIAYSYDSAEGDDITEVREALIGSDGKTATFTVQTTDDVLKEANETFSVEVTDVLTAAGGEAFEKVNINSAKVDTTIVDDGGSTVDVSLTASTSSVTEGESVTYTVKLSHAAPAGSKVKIDFTYPDSQGEDITEVREALIGEDGKTATFTVDTTDDVLKEADETFTVKITDVLSSSGTDAFENLNLQGAEVNTVIVDDGNSDVDITLTSDKTSVTEGEDVTYTVQLSHAAPAGSKVTIEYVYPNAKGEDITEIREALIDDDGKTATFTVQTTDDVLKEASEDFSVRVTDVLTTAGGKAFEKVNLTHAEIDTTIVDDGNSTVEVSLSANTNAVTEGESVTYTVKLSHAAPAGSKVKIDFTYTDSQGEDITEVQEAEIGPDGKSATFTVNTTDDVLKEANETFTVAVTDVLSSSGTDAFENLDLNKAKVDTVIVDDGSSIVDVTLTQDKNAVTEGDDVTYTVELSDKAPPNSKVLIDYTYTNSQGEDITEVREASINEDGMTASFVVTTTDDVLKEGNETFSVEVTQVVSSSGLDVFENVNLNGAKVDTTIIDDGNSVVEVVLTADKTNVTEGDTVTYTVELNNEAPPGSKVTIDYAYTTAEGEDITEVREAEIGPDGKTASFEVIMTNDVLNEDSETFSVMVTDVKSPSGAEAFENLDLNKAKVDTTIVDAGDSIVDVTLSANKSDVTEGDSVTYTVELSHAAPAGSKIKIDFTYPDSQGEDITEVKEAEIGPDGKTATFTVNTTDDVLKEANETFSVNVTDVLSQSGSNAFENVNLNAASIDTTIIDDGQSVVDITLTADKTSVTEGDAITYTVKLSHDAPANSKVKIAYTYPNAQGEDITEIKEATIEPMAKPPISPLRRLMMFSRKPMRCSPSPSRR
ncbi:hypothetical protein CS022_04990 [Veronia nyctiphanis]|uniref:Uncharacterized protein n=2 Tax=Veronia nyctiphanis TaxID=1278244 RepID=A0A4Q0YS35_9GAMM|nr:hypothetical protein CS022_04990 [Veronia nyctiphanis]